MSQRLSSGLAGNPQLTAARGYSSTSPQARTRSNALPCPWHSTAAKDSLEHRNERQNNPQGVGRTPNAVAAVRFSRKPAKAGEALPGEGRSGTDHSPRRASALFSFLAPVHCFPPPSPVLNEREGNSRKAHSEESHVPIHCCQNSKLLIQWLQGPENLSWLKQSLICAIKLPTGKSVTRAILCECRQVAKSHLFFSMSVMFCGATFCLEALPTDAARLGWCCCTQTGFLCYQEQLLTTHGCSVPIPTSLW